MINWFKNLFKKKTGVYIVDREVLALTQSERFDHLAFRKKVGEVTRAMLTRSAYDPSQDEDKILRGEVESYFE